MRNWVTSDLNSMKTKRFVSFLIGDPNIKPL